MQNSFSYERFRTKTRFETEAQENSEMAYYKITESLRALSLVDRCVQMKVCKHGCDVLDSRVL